MPIATAPRTRVGGGAMSRPRGSRRARKGVATRHGWFGRWSRLIAVLLIVVVLAAALELLGVPTLLAVAVAVITGVVVHRFGPLRSSRRVGAARLTVLVVVLTLLAGTSASYTKYLAAPGAAPIDVRTADWMRDHGMSPIVDAIEQRLYAGESANGPVTRSQLPGVTVATQPSLVQGSASAPHASPAAPATPRPAAPAVPAAPRPAAPAPITALIDRTLPGEGVWTANSRTVNGAPVTLTTFFRPDPAHTRALAAAVWMDPSTTRLVYAPGTEQPGGSGWAWGYTIPQSQRAGLVAAFNSGFKFKDITGGVVTEGRTARPLVDGQAALVIYADGHTDVGVWGGDLTMTPEVVTVRQNLDMIVAGGRPVDGVATSAAAPAWGKARWQLQLTQRSGIGMTADGVPVYVAGTDLTTATLADALVKVGAVRGMELDIHTKQSTFNFFTPAPGTAAGVTGTKLLPAMQRPADRYLIPDQRDFFALVLR